MSEPPGAVAPGRVAVVTGAASGIGLGLCERFAAEGMRVVMADVEAPELSAQAARLSGHGATVLPVVTDVSGPEQVEALRDRAVAAFGAVHVLCNNAGVGGGHGRLWEISRSEWDWVLGVNLGGVINGIRVFVPLLLEQEAAHVVNTASVFGVFAGALGPYGISKHAVVALSETLHLQLRALAPAEWACRAVPRRGPHALRHLGPQPAGRGRGTAPVRPGRAGQRGALPAAPDHHRPRACRGRLPRRPGHP